MCLLRKEWIINMKYKVKLNGKLYEVEVEQAEATMPAVPAAAAISVAQPTPSAVPAAVAPAAQSAASVIDDEGELISSPLPGTIMEIMVSLGQNIKKGQILLLIEAMKMENEVLAPRDGVVKQIITSKGSSVETGSPLLMLA